MELGFLNWSLKLYRTSTLEVRASWLLGVWVLFDGVRFAHAGLWGLVPFALLVPTISMYVHAMAHVAMARLVGGSADRTVLSIINDQTNMQVPLTAGKQFVVGAAGPFVSLVLWLSCSLLMHIETLGPFTILLAGYIAGTNLIITLFNMLACAIFDGARIWRAILWPLFGLTRAIRTTVILSFISAALLIGFGIYWTDLLMLIIGVMCVFATIQEHRSVKLGFDPVLGIEFDTIMDRRGQSWFGRWQQRRRVRAAERRERELENEQQTIDALLEKVSRDGLQSLTPQERTTLNRISARQKERERSGT